MAAMVRTLATLLFLGLFRWNSAQLGHFWQVTDVHWDKQYSRTGDPQNLCYGEGIVADNGFYGNSLCDTGFELMDLSIQAMALLEPNPDFILWTGDNSAHMDYPNMTWDEVYETCRVITQQLSQWFPSSIILPVLGNHDTVPMDQFPADDLEFYQAYLTQGNWSYLIPQEQWSTFLKGGYYSTVIKPGLKVIVLNTGLYISENENITEQDLDPSGQFLWLLEELQMSRNTDEKVIVTSHVPPGCFPGSDTLNLKPAFNDKLVEMLANNSDVILTVIFGHEHMDTFLLLKDQIGIVRTQAFLASSVNLWIVPFEQGSQAVNAGVRLYDYDLDAAIITDYKQFYIDFMEANENVTTDHVCSNTGNITGGDAVCVCSSTTPNACALMQLLYRPTLTYNIPDLRTASMVTVYENLHSDLETFEVFYNHSSLDYVLVPCSSTCKKGFLCSIANITDSEIKACLNSTDSDPQEMFST